MNPPTLTSGNPQIVVVPGDILSTTAESLRQLIQPVLTGHGSGRLLELDLRATRMIDSVGLNLLVTVIKRTKAAGGQVRLRVTHANVVRILHFSRLQHHVEILTA